MDIDRKTRMQTLLRDADIRSVLEWYGLPIHDRHCLRFSLEDFCGAHDVDVEDVLLELTGAETEVDEDDYTEWLYL